MKSYKEALLQVGCLPYYICKGSLSKFVAPRVPKETTERRRYTVLKQTLRNVYSCQLSATFQTSGCILAEQGPTSFILVPIDSTTKCHLYNVISERTAHSEVRLETVDAVIDKLPATCTQYRPTCINHQLSADFGSFVYISALESSLRLRLILG